MSNLKNLNRFTATANTLDMQRSSFDLSHSVKTTLIPGKLTPISLIEVLPGDTFSIDFSTVTRLLNVVAPVMDSAYVDVFAFFVPNRIATAHENDWQKICGENFDGYWASDEEHTLISTGNTFVPEDEGVPSMVSLASYYGVPQANINEAISLLPFNGYWFIWNEWFRDQNLQPPFQWKSNVDLTSIMGSNSLLSVNKFHDRFTTCLLAPQKGDAILLPLGDIAPINMRLDSTTSTQNSFSTGTAYDFAFFGDGSETAKGTNGSTHPLSSSGSWNSSAAPATLYADLSNATAATINNLRQAFALQRLLEKDARGGTRYREMLKVHYGTTIADNTVQVPEYLAGKRFPINITQVLQTSETGSTPLGTPGAVSVTAQTGSIVNKSFTEFGYIHILACIRNNQTYSQGLDRTFVRNRRFDWYYPGLAFLGEQPVFKYELFANNSPIRPTEDNLGDALFGYQEAWSEYRFIPNKATGFFSVPNPDNDSDEEEATLSDSLSAWTYQNRFVSPPSLGPEFIEQNTSQIDNTLSVPGHIYFISDFWFNVSATRVMPTFSIPGLTG